MSANYIYDLRINTTITVKANNKAEAEALAAEIMNRLDLVDPVTCRSLDIDLEDGLDLMEVEEGNIDEALESMLWTALIRDGADTSYFHADHLAYENVTDYEQAMVDAEYTWEDAGFVVALYTGHLSLEEAQDMWASENVDENTPET